MRLFGGWSVNVGAELKQPPDIANANVSSQYVGTSEKSPLRSDDSPLYAECVQPSTTGGKPPAISYVLLRPGSDCNTTTVADVPDVPAGGGSPAYSDRGGGRAVRRRSSTASEQGGDLRALSDRLEQLGALEVARWLQAAAMSADAVAWTSVTHRGCCISLPHSGSHRCLYVCLSLSLSHSMAISYLLYYTTILLKFV